MSPQIIERVWWTCYARHYEVEQFKALGWESTGDLIGTGHGDYSELMKWSRSGEPVFPPRDEEEAALEKAVGAMG